MKHFLGLAAMLPLALLLHAADPATHADAAKITKGGLLAKGDNYNTTASHRDKAGEVEIHDKEVDVMYFTDGEATLVTGGKATGLKDTGPGQHRGTNIEGGETYKVKKGDVVVVPAGVPHWFKEVPKGVWYVNTKVIQP